MSADTPASTKGRSFTSVSAKGRSLGVALLGREHFVVPAVMALGLVLSLIMLAITGADLSEALPALFNGAIGDARAIEETLSQSIPVMLVGLGVAVGLRAGLFNIGGEGQLYVAALAAVVVSQALPFQNPVLAVALVLVVGAAAGGLWAGAAGWMRAYLGMNEVITTILLNGIGILLTGWAVHGPLRDRDGGGYPWSEKIAEPFRLPVLDLGPVTVPAGFLLALGASLVVWILLERTVVGVELRTLGDSPDASAYAGLRVTLLIVGAMVCAGALAGVGGVIELAGKQERLSDFFSPGYGFTAIAVALVGNARAGGVVLSALFFGALTAGASSMERIAQVPAATSLVAQAIIVALLVLARSDRLQRWIRARRQISRMLEEGASSGGRPGQPAPKGQTV